MNESELKSNWNKLKGRLKERWGELTDDELDRIAGKRDQLVGLVQERYNKAKDDALREVNDVLDRAIEGMEPSSEQQSSGGGEQRPND